MKIDIKSTNMDLTPSISTYIDEKVGALEKFINVADGSAEGTAPVEAFVEVAKTTNHHKNGDVFKAEINMKVSGELHRVDVSDWDLRVAIDGAKDLMERKLTESKNIKITKSRKGARKFKLLSSISPSAWFRK